MGVNWIEMEARLPRRGTEKFELQAGDQNFRDLRTQAGIRYLERRKKAQRESSKCKRLSKHGIMHGSGRREGRRRMKENGWHGHYGLPASSSSAPSWAPDAHHHRYVG